MDLIPIEPDENLEPLFNALTKFPFKFVKVNAPGDYEKENIVLRAEDDIDSLYGYMAMYIVEDMSTGIPDYSKSRFLTFDDMELQKGSTLQIFTRKGEDSTSIGFDTAALHHTVYWGLPEPIWHVPHTSIEIMKRGDSYNVGVNVDY